MQYDTMKTEKRGKNTTKLLGALSLRQGRKLVRYFKSSTQLRRSRSVRPFRSFVCGLSTLRSVCVCSKVSEFSNTNITKYATLSHSDVPCSNLVGLFLFIYSPRRTNRTSKIKLSIVVL